MRAIATAIVTGMLVLAGNTGTFAASFGFVPGHYYTTQGIFSPPVIEQWDPSGNLVATLHVPGTSELSDIRFGPDQQLYVVGSTWASIDGAVQVIAIDAQGTPTARYSMPNASTNGQLVFNDDGTFFFGTNRITVGQESSVAPFLPFGERGIVELPNGNLAAINGLAIYELTTEGSVVRKIFEAENLWNSDMRSLAYDAGTNSIYTHLAHGGYDILRIDFATGEIIQSTPSGPGMDLFLTREDSLLVGTFMNVSRLMTRDFEPRITFSSPWQYGTQFVPEPGTYVLALMGLIALGAARSRRQNEGKKIRGQNDLFPKIVLTPYFDSARGSRAVNICEAVVLRINRPHDPLCGHETVRACRDDWGA